MIQDVTRIIGVDLGQQRDYTAISITERVFLPTGKFTREPYGVDTYGRVLRRSVEEGRSEYRVRHLDVPL